jgi:hypothetical protein
MPGSESSDGKLPHGTRVVAGLTFRFLASKITGRIAVAMAVNL